MPSLHLDTGTPDQFTDTILKGYKTYDSNSRVGTKSASWAHVPTQETSFEYWMEKIPAQYHGAEYYVNVDELGIMYPVGTLNNKAPQDYSEREMLDALKGGALLMPGTLRPQDKRE